MTGFKPQIAPEAVEALLREQFGREVVGLRLLKGGNLSQAFAFGSADGEFVVRFNATPTGFLRDQYAGEHFAAPALPVPRVLTIGEREGTAFAISERAAGTHLHERPPAEYLQLLPRALDALDTLHRVAAGDSVGYGVWREPGHGQFASWRHFLEAAFAEEDEGFFAGWHRLFTESFLERDFYESAYRRMMEHAAACPEERWIIHGDFGFDNVLADDGRITGVLDWSNLSYGDFVYDLAWIDFFSQNPAVTALLRERYAPTTPNFAERLACYGCWIGLANGMRFFAKAGNRPAYDWAKGRVRHYLAS